MERSGVRWGGAMCGGVPWNGVGDGRGGAESGAMQVRKKKTSPKMFEQNQMK